MVDKERDLSEQLKHPDSNEVYKALTEIKEKYVRYHYKMKQLQKYSVIKLIIPLIEHPKFCSTSLSIVADGCLEFSFVNEVIKYDGIKSLMNIMEIFITDDIRSKACRALGNMAKFEIGFKAVLLVNPISVIVNFLKGTCNNKCKQVAVRTLMILGKKPKTLELVAEKSGVHCIAKLLFSSNVHLLTCSTRAFASFTQNCTLSFAYLLSDLQIFEVFVNLYSHADKSVQNNALVCLKNLTMKEEIRSNLIKSGAVKVFTEVLSTCKSKEMSRLAAFALCKCLDHLHMWGSNGTPIIDGLKALISILKNEDYRDIHLQIITSLLPLTCEYKVSIILLKLRLLEILIKVLKLYIKEHKLWCRSFYEVYAYSTVRELNSLENTDKCHLCKSNYAHSRQTETSDMGINNSLTVPNLSLEDISSSITDAESEYLWDFRSVTSHYDICSGDQESLSSPCRSFTPDIYSPSFRSWSVVLPKNGHESSFSYSICHSPTTSTYSNSVNIDNPYRNAFRGTRLFSNSDQLSSSLEESKNSSTSTVSDVVLPGTSKSDDLKKPLPKFLKKSNRCCELLQNTGTNIQPVKKKMKTENLNKDLLKYQLQDTSDIFNSESVCNSVSNKKPSATQKIDYIVFTFILRLYSKVKKIPNSPMADNFFFTVLIDYLCFIRNPCPQAETLLLRLIKNRYIFEKLIANGFFSDLEEKLSSNYNCYHRTYARNLYDVMKQIGRLEAESHFGVGTLIHILATSSKKKAILYYLCNFKARNSKIIIT